MTTGAGFAVCNMKMKIGRGVTEQWAGIISEADKVAQILKGQTREIAKGGKDLYEFKGCSDGLPEIQKALLACSDLIDEVSTKAVNVERLATLLEVEKHRSQHLQRLTALHRQVKKHVSDNTESTTAFENELKEKYFENKKNERMTAISRVRRNTHPAGSGDGTPSRSGSHPPPMKDSPVVVANSSLLSDQNTDCRAESVEDCSGKCTFCTYPIQDYEATCSMCGEPIPGRQEEEEEQQQQDNDDDDTAGGVEDETPSQSSSHTNTIKSIANTTNTTTTEGVLVEAPGNPSPASST